MRGDDATAEELRRLVSLVDDRGLAEHRPEVQALLAASRRALPPARPTARIVGTKLAQAGRGLLYLAVAPALLGAWFAPGPPAYAAVALLVLVLLVLHRARLGAFAFEAQFRTRWHAGMARDWIAEAFSEAAEHRYAAAAAALDVMAAWRRWRGWLPRRPAVEDIEAFLADAYGERAASQWRDALATLRDPAGDAGLARRLAALRWSALVVLFRDLAAAGSFRPDRAPRAPAPLGSARAAPAPIHGHGDAPETIHRVEDPISLERRRVLIEQIKRKRLDITRAYNWPMRKPAEIAHRDAYIAATRAEVVALEAELRTLPGA